MVGIGILSAAGTILEARYDADYAREFIYQSPYMYILLSLLCVCLFNVIIDRYPWKPHHLGFILSHIGIIVLCLGSLMTRLYGVDGSISFDIGQTNRFVSLRNRELAVFASFADSPPILVKSQPVDFLLHPPSKEPIVWDVGHKKLTVQAYDNWAVQDETVVASKNPQSGPAVRVQLKNNFVNLAQWINRPTSDPYDVFDLGPARVVLASATAKYQYKGGNEIVLRELPHEDPVNPVLRYEIYSRLAGNKRTSAGQLHIADVVPTGWMGIQLRLLRYLPKAEQRVIYLKKNHPNGVTTSAVQVDFGGDSHWIGLNSTVQFFDKNVAYYVTYRNALLDLGFNMTLDKFTVGHYQGTDRAKSYRSQVNVAGYGKAKIYMNHPLKYKGYTFYQASFQQNNQGQPTTSILSVNRDPGRWLKYLGSFLIVLGTIVMFWFKRYRMKIFGKRDDEEAA